MKKEYVVDWIGLDIRNIHNPIGALVVRNYHAGQLIRDLQSTQL